MKALKEILDGQIEKLKPAKFYRFQIFTQGSEKKNTVGMAYLKEGQTIYTLRLWTFLEDKFFLLPNKDDSTNFSNIQPRDLRIMGWFLIPID